jgi:phospholipid/cholesterol/gamma-HCH transport system substrate-binding protein
MSAKNSIEFMAGLFLLLGIAALVVLATAATDAGTSLRSGSYNLSASFANIGDLKLRAPVTIGGVTVGSVEAIELDPATFEAQVSLKINIAYNEIPDDSSASILTSGILGDQYIGLEPGGSPDYLQEGDQILITQPALVIEQLIGKYLFNTSKEEE